MISNPKHGWCDFKLRTFEGTPSYLTDVPVDLLGAFIDYYTKGQGMAWFNEEGTEFTLVINPYSLFIIEEKENTMLYDFSEMNVEKLAKELINDIEKDLTGWSEFLTGDDQEEIKLHRDEIRHRITKLKKKTVLSLGITMNARGGPGIVLATTAFAYNIINVEFFTVLIITTMLSSMIAGYWLRVVKEDIKNDA